MASQNQIILSELKMGKSLTAFDAIEYGCMRLAARICDLRKLGHNIKTVMINSKGRSYAKYYLDERL